MFYLDNVNFNNDNLKIRDVEARGLIQDNTNAINSVKAKADKNEKDIKALDDRLTAAEEDITNHEGRLDVAESDIDNLETHMDKAEADIKSLRADLTEAEKDIDALEDRMDEAESDIDSLEDRMDKAESDIEQLNKDLTDYKESNDAWQETQDSRLDSIEAKDVEQDQKLEDLDAKIDEEVSNLEDEIERVDSEIDDLKKKDAEQDKTIEELDKRITASTYEAGEGIYFGQGIDHTSINVEDELLAEIHASTEKNIEQDERLDTIEEKDREQDGRLDAIEKKDAEQDKRLDAIEAKDVEQDGRLDSLETRMDTAESDIDNLEERMTEAESDIDNLEDRMTTTEAKDEEQDGRLDSLEERMTSTENKDSEQDEKISSLESTSQDHEDRIGQLETEVDSLDARVETIEDTLDDIPVNIDLGTIKSTFLPYDPGLNLELNSKDNSIYSLDYSSFKSPDELVKLVTENYNKPGVVFTGYIKDAETTRKVTFNVNNKSSGTKLELYTSYEYTGTNNATYIVDILIQVNGTKYESYIKCRGYQTAIQANDNDKSTYPELRIGDGLRVDGNVLKTGVIDLGTISISNPPGSNEENITSGVDLSNFIEPDELFELAQKNMNNSGVVYTATIQYAFGFAWRKEKVVVDVSATESNPYDANSVNAVAYVGNIFYINIAGYMGNYTVSGKELRESLNVNDLGQIHINTIIGDLENGQSKVVDLNTQASIISYETLNNIFDSSLDKAIIVGQISYANNLSNPTFRNYVQFNLCRYYANSTIFYLYATNIFSTDSLSKYDIIIEVAPNYTTARVNCTSFTNV